MKAYQTYKPKVNIVACSWGYQVYIHNELTGEESARLINHH